MATKKPTREKNEHGEAKAKLDAFGIDAICAAILHPKPMRAIAEEIGVSQGTLVEWIGAKPERSARAREARAQTAQMWDDKATQVVEDAQDQFQLAKARELAHHYRWRAAKIAPREYGDKVDVNHGGQVENPLSVLLGQVQGTPLRPKSDDDAA